MASKGQKFMHFTDEERKEILDKHLQGYSARYLGEMYGISRKTIETWKQKILHPKKNTCKKRGRPKEKDLTKEDYKERYEIIKKYQAFLKAQRERK